MNKNATGRLVNVGTRLEDFSKFLRKHDFTAPEDITFRKLIVGFKAGEGETQCGKFARFLEARYEECDVELMRVKTRYLGALATWRERSGTYAPAYKAEQAKLHGELGHKGAPLTCKQCKSPEAQAELEQRVSRAAPQEFKAAREAMAVVRQVDAEVKGAKAERDKYERLLKGINPVIKKEKELNAVSEEHESLQEKIDGYPDAARMAERRLPELDRLLAKHAEYKRQEEQVRKLERRLELEKNSVEKIERHGAFASREQLEGVQGQINLTRAQMSALEAALRASRPSFIGMRPHEIHAEVKKEWDSAQGLVERYDDLRKADMDKLERLNAAKGRLKEEFAAAQDRYAEEVRAANIGVEPAF